jgi:hypothetical protein
MLLKQSAPLRMIVLSPANRPRIAPETRIRRIGGPSSLSVDDELTQAKIAWKNYQSTRKRDAIYDYLRAVFKIVRRWRKEHRAKTSSYQALRATGSTNKIRKVEPFAIVIFCTSDPRKVDAKTRAKWSRVLRYAEQFKPDTQNLTQFVKSNGGINECCAVVRTRSRIGENTRSLKRPSGAQF